MTDLQGLTKCIPDKLSPVEARLYLATPPSNLFARHLDQLVLLKGRETPALSCKCRGLERAWTLSLKSQDSSLKMMILREQHPLTLPRLGCQPQEGSCASLAQPMLEVISQPMIHLPVSVPPYCILLARRAAICTSRRHVIFGKGAVLCSCTGWMHSQSSEGNGCILGRTEHQILFAI